MPVTQFASRFISLNEFQKYELTRRVSSDEAEVRVVVTSCGIDVVDEIFFMPKGVSSVSLGMESVVRSLFNYSPPDLTIVNTPQPNSNIAEISIVATVVDTEEVLLDDTFFIINSDIDTVELRKAFNEVDGIGIFSELPRVAVLCYDDIAILNIFISPNTDIAKGIYERDVPLYCVRDDVKSELCRLSAGYWSIVYKCEDVGIVNYGGNVVLRLDDDIAAIQIFQVVPPHRFGARKNDLCFVYENCFGGSDIFRTSGEVKSKGEAKSEYLLSGTMRRAHMKSFDESISVNSGFLYSEEHKAMLSSMFRSANVYLYSEQTNAMERLLITKAAPSMPRREISNCEFEFKYADSNRLPTISPRIDIVLPNHKPSMFGKSITYVTGAQGGEILLPIINPPAEPLKWLFEFDDELCKTVTYDREAQKIKLFGYKLHERSVFAKKMLRIVDTRRDIIFSTIFCSAPYIDISESEKTLPNTAGSFSFDIKSNIEYTIECNKDWIILSASAGSGHLVVTATYTNHNQPYLNRDAQIMIKSAFTVKTINITQEPTPPYLRVVPSSTTVGLEAGYVNINIESNVYFQSNSDDDWLDSDLGYEGFGDTTLKIEYTKNPGMFARESKVNFYDGRLLVSFTLMQVGSGINPLVEGSINESETQLVE